MNNGLIMIYTIIRIIFLEIRYWFFDFIELMSGNLGATPNSFASCGKNGSVYRGFCIKDFKNVLRRMGGLCHGCQGT